MSTGVEVLRKYYSELTEYEKAAFLNTVLHKTGDDKSHYRNILNPNLDITTKNVPAQLARAVEFAAAILKCEDVPRDSMCPSCKGCDALEYMRNNQ